MECYSNYLCARLFTSNVVTFITGPGAVVNAGKTEIAGSNPTLAFKFRLNKNVSSPLTREDSIWWGASVTERYRARPQTTRARISNAVSGGSVTSFIS